MKKILTIIGMFMILIISVSGIMGLQSNMTPDDIRVVSEYLNKSQEDMLIDNEQVLEIQDKIMELIDEHWKVGEYFRIEKFVGNDGFEIITGHLVKSGDEWTVEVDYRESIYFDYDRINKQNHPKIYKELDRAEKYLNHDGYTYTRDGDTYSILNVILQTIIAYGKIIMYYAVTIFDKMYSILGYVVEIIRSLFYLIGIKSTL